LEEPMMMEIISVESIPGDIAFFITPRTWRHNIVGYGGADLGNKVKITFPLLFIKLNRSI
jgi:hypothetical protein